MIHVHHEDDPRNQSRACQPNQRGSASRLMSSKLPLNLDDLLRQRTVECDRIEYKAGWNPDAVVRTLCAFANDFENLGGGYVVIGQDCDEHGQPIFPPVGLNDSQLDPIQRELLGYCNQIQPSYFPIGWNLSGAPDYAARFAIFWPAPALPPIIRGCSVLICGCLRAFSTRAYAASQTPLSCRTRNTKIVCAPAFFQRMPLSFRRCV